MRNFLRWMMGKKPVYRVPYFKLMDCRPGHVTYLSWHQIRWLSRTAENYHG